MLRNWDEWPGSPVHTLWTLVWISVKPRATVASQPCWTWWTGEMRSCASLEWEGIVETPAARAMALVDPSPSSLLFDPSKKLRLGIISLPCDEHGALQTPICFCESRPVRVQR